MKLYRALLSVVILFLISPNNAVSQKEKLKLPDNVRGITLNQYLMEEAEKRTRRAAEQGDASAQFQLGLMYFQGDAYGVSRDYEEAEKWFRKAAEQGNASAQFNLGLMYSKGNGVTKNYTEAVNWFRKAAEQGEASAQFQLGSMYYKGNGVTKNHTEAVNWYRKTAEQGNISALCILGSIYREGKGTAQDYVQTHMWLNLCATDGEAKQQKKGAKFRDEIARKMNLSQIQEAERMARQWKSAYILNLRVLEEGVDPGGPAIVFSTYFGGKNGQGRGLAITVDKPGFIYITGRTQAKDFPRANPVQKKYGGGENDAFVTKLTPDGQNIVYSTLLGGRDVDWGNEIVVDDIGNAYVAGTTYSRNFPTTKNAFQRKFGGGDRDGFIVKLDADGKLIFSTLLGGDHTDRCDGIDIDREGNIYATGSTNSQNFTPPLAMIGSQRADWDVWVVKLDPSGSNLLFAKRFGGSAGTGTERGGIGGESGSEIKIGDGNTVYVVGRTDSWDFPIRNGLQPKFGGRSDCFIARLGTEDGELLSSTFLGGAGSDRISAVDLDAIGNVYVTGTTGPVEPLIQRGGVIQNKVTSGDFPVKNAVQPKWTASIESAFLTKLNADLTEVKYSTYLSGSSIDRGSDIAVDGYGNAYVIGTAQSRDFPLVRPLQLEPSLQDEVGLRDVFITGISATGAELLFSTLMGSPGQDSGNGIAVNDSGDIYFIGDAGYGGSRRYPEYRFPTIRAIQPERGNKTFQTFVVRIRP